MAVMKKRDHGDRNRKEQGKKETGRKESGKKDVLPKEPVKTVKKEKVNRFEQVKKFFKGVFSELKKVHWPNRREVIIYTIVVLVAVVFVGVLIWLFDLIFSQAVLLIR
jgi:preprotein translocase subunit SecE